ncbi:MAG: VWA domain-containing protein [Polaromonas sp.]|nr:VWA domain-containing protein [Polaromonas sp.]
MSSTRQAALSNSMGESLVLEGVTARGVVHGRMLEMSLLQRFRNPGATNTEVTYTFPLPWGAVLLGVDVELNGQRLRGEVTARQTARAKYEEALSEGNTSIMLERNADLSYTLELGNLLAKEACVILVRYAQILQLEQGQLRLMLPTTIAPRYGNPLTQGGLQPHQVVETDICAEYPFDITITLHGSLAKANVASPSHKTAYQPGADELIVKLAQKGSLDRDFVLVLSELPQSSVGIASPDLWFPGRTTVMASFSPLLSQDSAKPVAVKILVDCSGSMNGDSMEAARCALRSIVMGMEKTDKFTLSRFGSTVEHRSRGMWSGSIPAKASGLRWVSRLAADLGGTEMAQALASTISLAHHGRCDLLLITDGEIQGINEVIDTAKTSGHRVFVVGIGASPAEVHLRRLAQATGGACDFVAPGEDVEPAVLRMFNRLRSPYVKKLQVEWPAGWEIEWASSVPDLAFEGDTLTMYAVVVGELEAPMAGQAKLWGHLEGQSSQKLLAQLEVGFVQDDANTLSRCARFEQFSACEQTHEFPKSKLVDMAVSYQLVSSETNFILVHERAEAEKPLEMPDSYKVPHMLASGWGGTGSVAGNIYGAPSQQGHRTGEAIHNFSASAGLNLPDNSSMSVPSVWRTSRTQATAKIGASSSGMDDIDIPMFLRRYADSTPEKVVSRRKIDPANADFWARHAPPRLSIMKVMEWEQDHPAHLLPVIYTGLTPAGVVEWLRINDASFWPKLYPDLQAMGLGICVCEWLEFVIGAEHDEAEVVETFVSVMLEFDFTITQGLRRTIKTLASVIRPVHKSAENLGNEILAEFIRQGLLGIQPRKWPDPVVNFAEVSDVL